MINELNLKVRQFAGKNGRLGLNGILVRPDATVATNGHCLVWMSTPEMKVECFPVVEGAPIPQGSHPSFLLPLDMAEEIEGALPGGSTIPILSCAAIAVEEGRPTVIVTDLKTSRQFHPPAPDGHFPNFEMIMAQNEKPTFQIDLSPEYLARIAKYAADVAGNVKNPRLRLSFYAEPGQKKAGPSNERAVRFDVVSEDGGQGMTAMLMPMRSGSDPIPHTYGWSNLRS